MNSTENPNKDESKTEVGSDSKQSSKYISLVDLLAQSKVSTKEESIDEDRQETADQAIKERETIRLGHEKYYELRDKWSWFIFSYICFMLIFQLFLTAAIGFGWADFSEYRTFLHIVMAENFAQIIGMGYIVAKYLFPNKSP